MPSDTVRIWRAPDESRVLLMAGWTRSYAVEPRGEYQSHLHRHFQRSLGITPLTYQRRSVS